MKHTPKQLWIAMRPWSFPVSVTPVILTTLFLAANNYNVNYWLALWALIGIIFFHAAGNLFSDYFDYKKGVDTDPSIGSATITGGILTPKETMVFACIMLGIATLCGLGLMLVTGWQLLIFGILGALLVIAYPWLKFHALGDLDILLCFGILPTLGTAFVTTGEILWASLWVTLTFATITVAVLHANNTRDTNRDGNAHIHTFAMLIGKKACQWTYYCEIWLPVVWVLVCVIAGYLHWTMLIFVLLAFAVMVRNTKTMMAFGNGGSIDKLDQMTAQHQLMNMLFLSAGLILQAFVW